MKFLCEQCKAKYQIADEKVIGKTVRMKCRKCGHLIEVRAAVTETSAPAERDRARPSAPPPPPRPPPPRPGNLAVSLASSKTVPRPPVITTTSGALEGAFRAAVHRDEEVSAPFDMADLSPSDDWYVAINGVPVGPIRVAEVRRKAALGAVTEESLVWQEGLDEWRPLRSFPELVVSIREAMSSARTSRPPPSDGRASLAPPSRGPGRPSVTGAGPSAPRVALPRLAPALPQSSQSITARSNVVPFVSRLATAERLDEAVHERTSEPPGAPHPKEPTPSVAPDPFGSNASDPFGRRMPAAPPAPAEVLAVPSLVPPGRSPPWIPIAGVAAATAFGVTVAILAVPRLLRSPAPPSSQGAAQLPAAPSPISSAAAPNAVNPSPPPNDLAEPTPAPLAATPAAKPLAAPRGATSPAAPPAGGASTGRSLDLHSLTQTIAPIMPPEDPAGDSPKVAGQCVSTAQFQQVYSLHQAGVRRACWERNPTSKSAVSVNVSMTIGPDGNAQSVSATGDEPSVAKCIENDVRAWHFPAMGCSQQVSIPFKFVKQ